MISNQSKLYNFDIIQTNIPLIERRIIIKRIVFLFITFILLALLISNIIITYTTYNIDDNIVNIEKNIKDSIKEKFKSHSKNSSKTININVKNTLNIDHKKIIVFIINNKLIGRAELESSWNKKYKIVSIGYSNIKPYNSSIIQDSKYSYLVIVGKKYNLKINYLNVVLSKSNFQNNSLQKITYKLQIPKEEYFIIR